MKSLSLLSLTFLVLTVVLRAHAAEPINIGSVSASLGADQQTLLDALRKEYDVKGNADEHLCGIQGRSV